MQSCVSVPISPDPLPARRGSALQGERPAVLHRAGLHGWEAQKLSEEIPADTPCGSAVQTSRKPQVTGVAGGRRLGSFVVTVPVRLPMATSLDASQAPG